MIKIENITIDGRTLVKTYSDSGYYIERNDGVQYDAAIDVVNSGYTYTETDVLINDMTEIEKKAMAYDILMGVR